jgi:hypothetical protein
MNNSSKTNTILLVILIVSAIGVFLISRAKKAEVLEQKIVSPVEKQSLKSQYLLLKKQHTLKYLTLADALNEFRNQTDKNIEVKYISFYVPGKLPREDGNPYFIGRGTLDKNKNECIFGYMNLVTGLTKSYKEVCIIYD